MREIVISLLVLFGTTFSVVAQDKLILRNGRTIEVNIQRNLEDRVEYTYPGESTVYERPKSAISEIRYESGKVEILDERLKQSEETPQSRQQTSQTSVRSNSQTNADGIPWQDVKTTFTTEDVNNLKRLQRVTATSTVSYKDAILKLKKKAAEIGGTTVLVMDDPDNSSDKTIEVIGIAYRDESLEIASSKMADAPAERPSASTSAQSSSNTRRRRILQQMESYNNDSKLDLSDKPEPRQQTPARNSQKELEYEDANAIDAIYLLNGRVIRGIIEEFEPDDFVSIRNDKGKVIEYSMDDVRRVQRGNAGVSQSNSRQASRQTNATSRRSDNESAYDSNNRSSRTQSRPPRTSNYREESYSGGSATGYKGTFDLGYTLPMGVGEQGRIEVHTSHGMQLNDYLFIGAGVGLHVYSARDVNLKYSKTGNVDNYPRYKEDGKTPAKTIGNYTVITPDSATTWMHAVDSSYMVLPVFIDLRGYYPVSDKLAPFVTFRLGYSFNLTDGLGGMGLYMNPAVGIKYNLSTNFGITFSLGYSTQSYGGVPGKNQDGGYGFYYIKEDKKLYEAKNAGGITLKLGVEF